MNADGQLKIRRARTGFRGKLGCKVNILSIEEYIRWMKSKNRKKKKYGRYTLI